MSIKKQSSSDSPAPGRPAAAKKAKRSAAPASQESKQPLYTPRLAAAAAKRSKTLGAPLDPRTLPGAEDAAGAVVNQVWEVLANYQEPPAKITWRFFADGTLAHEKFVGIWRQAGGAIVVEINGRYSEFWGVIKGSEAFGDAKNIAGLTWGWTATIR